MNEINSAKEKETLLDNNLIKKEYEISIWEDVPKEDYFDEVKIATIGANDMTANHRCINPVFTENINGTQTLTFTMYTAYFDEEQDQWVQNPFSKLLVNERKIKLKYNDNWYDFIIKNIQESSQNNSFQYTCESLPINELSKIGFNIELKNELMNNVDTINGFVRTILSETDWTLPQENETLLQEKIEDVVYEVKLGNSESGITATRIVDVEKEGKPSDNKYEKSTTIPSGSTIYCSYSSFNSDSTSPYIYFLYRPDGNYEKDESTRIITNADCYYILRKDFPSNFSKEISNEYRGNFLVKQSNVVYEPLLDKFCDSYTVREIKDSNNIKLNKGDIVYSYNEIETVEPFLIKNLLSETTYQSLQEGAEHLGWTAYKMKAGDTDHSDPMEKATDGIYNFLYPFMTYDENKLSMDEDSKQYIWLNLRDNIIYNSGLFDNLGDFTEGLIAGKKYVYRIKYKYFDSTDAPPSIIDIMDEDKKDEFNRELKVPVEINGEDIEVTCLPPRLKIAKYTYTDDGKIQLEGNYLNCAYNSEEGSTTFYDSNSGYFYVVSEIRESVTYQNLLNNNFGFFFYINSGKDISYAIEDVELFPYQEYNGKIIVPPTPFSDSASTNSDKIIDSVTYYNDEGNLTQGLVKEKTIYFKKPADTVTNKEDITYLSDGLLISVKDNEENSNEYQILLEKTYNDKFEKKRTVEVSESNCFNILQTLCEQFECWIQFNIEHDKDTGKILRDPATNRQKKTISFIDYEQKPINYSGFKYGINLNSIQRTLMSDQIVSKLIVKDGTNSLAKNGFCTIARANDNPTGENFFYDFSYYINQKLIDYNEVMTDLYDPSNGYYTRYKKLNLEYQQKATYANEINLNITKLQAEVTYYKELIEASNSELTNQIAETKAEVNNALVEIKDGSETKEGNLNNFSNLMNGIGKLIASITIAAAGALESSALAMQYSAFIKFLDNKRSNISNTLKQRKEEYKSIMSDLDNIANEKKDLNKEFYSKYSRYIQEGTWTSNDYIDDDLYYYDAQNVLSSSVSPKVNYTINVIDISQLEDWKMYKFNLGDHTYIEDTDFFGWLATVNNNEIIYTPYKEEVIVSQISWALDSPESNQITIQNYKTQFEDLFQRITATTQSLQFASGAYNRAANSINPEGTFDADLLQNTLLSKIIKIINPGNTSLVWDSNGIKVIDKKNQNNIIKLSNGQIAISSNGGATWTTAITSKGINIGLLTSGVINTEQIYIGNSSDYTFRWDKRGINAYTTVSQNSSDGTKIDITNYNKFVRFDKYGIYGITNGNEDFVPSDITEVQNTATFSLTWNGFRLKSTSSNNNDNIGYIDISSDKDFNVYTKNNGNYISKITIGRIEKESGDIIYGIIIRDNIGNSVFETDENGNLSITGKITATSGKIGGWTIYDNKLSSIPSNLNDNNNSGIVLNANQSSLYSNSYLNSNGSTGWAITENSAYFNNITLRGALKCAVLEYAEVQTVGGVLMVRPATSIKKRIFETNPDGSIKNYYDSCYDITTGTLYGIPKSIKLEVENNKIFRERSGFPPSYYPGDWCKLTTRIDDDKKEENDDGTTQLYSGINTNLFRCSKIIDEEVIEEIDGEEIRTIHQYIYLNVENIAEGSEEENKLLNLNFEGLGLINFGLTTPEIQENKKQNPEIIYSSNIGIGLNSSDNSAMIPETSLSVFSLEENIDNNNNNNWKYLKPHVILGKIPDDEKTYGTIAGSYGLYSDNCYLKGAISATSGTIGGWTISLGVLSGGYTDLETNEIIRSVYLSALSIPINNPINQKETINASIIAGKNFAVSPNGILYASEAHISGVINASSGFLGKWVINNYQLYCDYKDNENKYWRFFIQTNNGNASEGLDYNADAIWQISGQSYTKPDASDAVATWYIKASGNSFFQNIAGTSFNTRETTSGGDSYFVRINNSGALFKTLDGVIIQNSDLTIKQGNLGIEDGAFACPGFSAGTVDNTTGIFMSGIINYKSNTALSSENIKITDPYHKIVIGQDSGMRVGIYSTANGFNSIRIRVPREDDTLNGWNIWTNYNDNFGWGIKYNGDAILGQISTSSDKNRKNSIKNIPNKYEILFNNLKPSLYKYNNGTSNRYHTGFIAQDVENAIILAGLTTQDFAGLVIDKQINENTNQEESQYYLRYEEFIALNTLEIQKLKERIKILENKISEMQ